MITTVRQIKFVDQITFPFTGTVYPQALAVGDVDNDPFHDAEIAVGNLNGELAIFKGVSPPPPPPPPVPASQSALVPAAAPVACPASIPWRVSSELGSICCLLIGDIRGGGRNSLLVLTVEGLCHIFDFEYKQPNATEGAAPAPNTDAAPSRGAIHESPTQTVRVPSNASCATLSTTIDGQPELIVGTRTREVHVLGFAVPPPPATAQATNGVAAPAGTSHHHSGRHSLSSSPSAGGGGMFPPSSPLFGSMISASGAGGGGNSAHHRSRHHAHNANRSHSFSLGVNSSIPPPSPLFGPASTGGMVRTPSGGAAGGGVAGGRRSAGDYRLRTDWQLKRLIHSLPAPVLSISTAPVYRMRGSTQAVAVRSLESDLSAPPPSITEHSIAIIAGLESGAVLIDSHGTVSPLAGSASSSGASANPSGAPAAHDSQAPAASATTQSQAAASSSSQPVVSGLSSSLAAAAAARGNSSPRAGPMATPTPVPAAKPQSIYTSKPAAVFDCGGAAYMSPRSSTLASAGFSMYSSQSSAAAAAAAAKLAAKKAAAAAAAAAAAVPPPVNDPLRMLVFGHVRIQNTRPPAAVVSSAAAPTAAAAAAAAASDEPVLRYNNEGELVRDTSAPIAASVVAERRAAELKLQQQMDHDRCVARTQLTQRLRAADHRRAVVSVNAFGQITLTLLVHPSSQHLKKAQHRDSSALPSMLERGVEFSLTPTTATAPTPPAAATAPSPLGVHPLEYRHSYRLPDTRPTTASGSQPPAPPSLGSVCGTGGKVLAVSALDMSDDGRDELVVCMWDGWTHCLTTPLPPPLLLPDADGSDSAAAAVAAAAAASSSAAVHVSRFKFRDRVAAFAAASFSLTPGHPTRCYVYVSADTGSVVVFPGVYTKSLNSAAIVSSPPAPAAAPSKSASDESALFASLKAPGDEKHANGWLSTLKHQLQAAHPPSGCGPITGTGSAVPLAVAAAPASAGSGAATSPLLFTSAALNASPAQAQALASAAHALSHVHPHALLAYRAQLLSILAGTNGTASRAGTTSASSTSAAVVPAGVFDEPLLCSASIRKLQLQRQQQQQQQTARQQTDKASASREDTKSEVVLSPFAAFFEHKRHSIAAPAGSGTPRISPVSPSAASVLEREEEENRTRNEMSAILRGQNGGVDHWARVLTSRPDSPYFWHTLKCIHFLQHVSTFLPELSAALATGSGGGAASPASAAGIILSLVPRVRTIGAHFGLSVAVPSTGAKASELNPLSAPVHQRLLAAATAIDKAAFIAAGNEPPVSAATAATASAAAFTSVSSVTAARARAAEEKELGGGETSISMPIAIALFDSFRAVLLDARTEVIAAIQTPLELYVHARRKEQLQTGAATAPPAASGATAAAAAAAAALSPVAVSPLTATATASVPAAATPAATAVAAPAAKGFWSKLKNYAASNSNAPN